MTKQSDRAQRLRHSLTNFTRVGAEVTSAFNQTEDVLTTLEDREARRSQRQASATVPDRLRQSMGGQ